MTFSQIRGGGEGSAFLLRLAIGKGRDGVAVVGGVMVSGLEISPLIPIMGGRRWSGVG